MPVALRLCGSLVGLTASELKPSMLAQPVRPPLLAEATRARRGAGGSAARAKMRWEYLAIKAKLEPEGLTPKPRSTS